MNLDQLTNNLATTLLDGLTTNIAEIGTQPIVVLHQQTAIDMIKTAFLTTIERVEAKCQAVWDNREALEEAICCKCGNSYSVAGMRKLDEHTSICLVCDIQPIPFVPVEVGTTDDDLPVTEEWLISVGLYKKPTSLREHVFDVRLSLVFGLSTGTLHPGRRKARLRKWKRGDIRTLCRLLEINLSEPVAASSPESIDQIDCVECHGQGKVTATFADHADGSFSHSVVMKCHRCKGSKRISKEQLEWIEQGSQLSRFRRTGNQDKGFQNLVEFAQKYGRTPAEISRMERGELKIPAEIWLDVIKGA